MRLRDKLLRGLTYTFAFGLVSISLLTRKSYGMGVGPESVPTKVMPKGTLPTGATSLPNMKKDSENLESSSTRTIKLSIPSESDLRTIQTKADSHQAEHHEITGKLPPLPSPPKSYIRSFYNICKKGTFFVTNTGVEFGGIGYQNGKIQVNPSWTIKLGNSQSVKTLQQSVETLQQSVETLQQSVETPKQYSTDIFPSPSPSLRLKDFLTPKTITTLVFTTAIATRPVESIRYIAHQFSALYGVLKEKAPPASLRRLRQLIGTDRFVNNRATFTVSDKENKRREANIFLYKASIFAPARQFERGSIYIANKRISNTLILQCMYGKIVKANEFAKCEIAFDMNVPPCFAFKPSSSLALWCYIPLDVANKLECDFTGIDELMQRGEL